jgi:hypothetical protein
MKAVEAGLGVLGESGRTATFYFIESNGGLKRAQIPANPDILVTALRTIFGLGSRELMISILRALQLAKFEGDDKLLHRFTNSVESGIRSVESGIA